MDVLELNNRDSIRTRIRKSCNDKCKNIKSCMKKGEICSYVNCIQPYFVYWNNEVPVCRKHKQLLILYKRNSREKYDKMLLELKQYDKIMEFIL